MEYEQLNYLPLQNWGFVQITTSSCKAPYQKSCNNLGKLPTYENVCNTMHEM